MSDVAGREVLDAARARLEVLCAEVGDLVRDTELRTGVSLLDYPPRPTLRGLTWADVSHVLDQFALAEGGALLLSKYATPVPGQTLGAALKIVPPAVAERALALLVESGLFDCPE